MTPQIHPPVDAATACAKCGECCKRYAISVLPDELVKEAQFLKIDTKTFVGLYTKLLVQITPYSSANHPLSLSVSMLPKPLWEKLKTVGFDSAYAMILPMIGFQKREYCVFFQPETFGCAIHSVKPQQCRIFPFTSLKENEDYAKSYDFCELARISSPTTYTHVEQDTQRLRMRAYFDAIGKLGLEKVWPHLPAAGELVYSGRFTEKITLNELNEWLSLARGKKSTEKN